jgi:hypothetical protein
MKKEIKNLKSKLSMNNSTVVSVDDKQVKKNEENED